MLQLMMQAAIFAATPPSFTIETASLECLIAHIDTAHHVFTRVQLDRISGLIAALDDAGTPITPELRDCCRGLEADLLPHLMKEEQILFPYIIALEKSPDHPPRAFFGSISNPICMMNAEHVRMDVLLNQLRMVTEFYQPGPGSPPQAVELYSALAELDANLVRHMYLEDEVLFPRALQLEQEILR